MRLFSPAGYEREWARSARAWTDFLSGKDARAWHTRVMRSQTERWKWT
jgi:hypothetical protein